MEESRERGSEMGVSKRPRAGVEARGAGEAGETVLLARAWEALGLRSSGKREARVERRETGCCWWWGTAGGLWLRLVWATAAGDQGEGEYEGDGDGDGLAGAPEAGDGVRWWAVMGSGGGAAEERE